MALPRVTVWNEGRHEKTDAAVQAIYPEGIHTTIAKALTGKGLQNIRTATLDEPEHGLPQQLLDQTDVLLWWSHIAHDDFSDEIVQRVYERVLKGMGLIVLHSAHFSKIFKKLMGTSCRLNWREIGERERLWCVNPGHPIAVGLPEYFEIEHEEMYGEYFDIPTPDQLVFISWFAGGEVFRSGCCFFRGAGKIFYFRPGHETLPTYHQPAIQQVLYNAVLWAAPVGGPAVRLTADQHPEPIENIKTNE